MINFSSLNPTPGRLTLWLTLLLMVSPPVFFSAMAGTTYKKSTVIDFEGSMVEGKSRKPYSAYLSQQKDSAFTDLHLWQPDLDKRLLDSQVRLDHSP